MSKLYEKTPEYVEVMYVTDDTFDAPHPNEDHMTSMTFHPDTRTVELDHPCDDDEKVARVGDVIVRHGKDGENAWDSIWPADMFERNFVPRRKWAAVAVDGCVTCLHCGRGCKDASYPQGTCDECEAL